VHRADDRDLFLAGTMYEIAATELGDREQRGTVSRYISAGRKRLHDRGVLPWAAFARGAVPADWLRSPEFAEAVQRWRHEAVDRLALPPGGGWIGVAFRRMHFHEEVDHTPWTATPRSCKQS
jgi:hypothetical protein